MNVHSVGIIVESIGANQLLKAGIGNGEWGIEEWEKRGQGDKEKVRRGDAETRKFKFFVPLSPTFLLSLSPFPHSPLSTPILAV
jgi:hypothetical protein